MTANRPLASGTGGGLSSAARLCCRHPPVRLGRLPAGWRAPAAAALLLFEQDRDRPPPPGSQAASFRDDWPTAAHPQYSAIGCRQRLGRQALRRQRKQRKDFDIDALCGLSAGELNDEGVCSIRKRQQLNACRLRRPPSDRAGNRELHVLRRRQFDGHIMPSDVPLGHRADHDMRQLERGLTANEP
jgi:hypothetical protein